MRPRATTASARLSSTSTTSTGLEEYFHWATAHSDKLAGLRALLLPPHVGQEWEEEQVQGVSEGAIGTLSPAGLSWMVA